MSGLGQLWGRPDKVILGVGPGWVVMDLVVALEANGEKVLGVGQLFPDPARLVMNLRGGVSANLASRIFGQVLEAKLPIKRTHPPALG